MGLQARLLFRSGALHRQWCNSLSTTLVYRYRRKGVLTGSEERGHLFDVHLCRLGRTNLLLPHEYSSRLAARGGLLPTLPEYCQQPHLYEPIVLTNAKQPSQLHAGTLWPLKPLPGQHTAWGHSCSRWWWIHSQSWRLCRVPACLF